jgi:hypothetical protein
LLSLFEGIAGASVLYEGVGMIGARSPVAAGADEFLFGYEIPAITAFQLFIINLIVAGLSECCKLLLHASPFSIQDYDPMKFGWCQPVVSSWWLKYDRAKTSGSV